MKSTLFLTSLFSYCSIFSIASTLPSAYRPMSEDGKEWQTRVGLIMENLYTSRVEGDTIIGGESWKKIYNSTFWPGIEHSYCCAIRDVGKKVYAIAKGSRRARLLYDFSLNEGDIVRCGVEGTSLCCLLDTEEELDTLLGFPFKAWLRVERLFTLIMLDSFGYPLVGIEKPLFNNVIWVEGVGSSTGPFSSWLPPLPENGIMQSCKMDSKYYFSFQSFEESQGTGDIGNTSGSPIERSAVFDLLGRAREASAGYKSLRGVSITQGRKRLPGR